MGQAEGGAEDPSHGGGEVRGGRRPARGQWLWAAGVRPAPDLSRPEAHDSVADTLDTGRHITVSALNPVMANDYAKKPRQTQEVPPPQTRRNRLGVGGCVYVPDSLGSVALVDPLPDTTPCLSCVRRV